MQNTSEVWAQSGASPCEMSASGTDRSFHPVNIIPPIFHNQFFNHERYVSLETTKSVIIYHA